jgi:hypothetical protein
MLMFKKYYISYNAWLYILEKYLYIVVVERDVLSESCSIYFSVRLFLHFTDGDFVSADRIWQLSRFSSLQQTGAELSIVMMDFLH